MGKVKPALIGLVLVSSVDLRLEARRNRLRKVLETKRAQEKEKGEKSRTYALNWRAIGALMGAGSQKMGYFFGGASSPWGRAPSDE